MNTEIDAIWTHHSPKYGVDSKQQNLGIRHAAVGSLKLSKKSWIIIAGLCSTNSWRTWWPCRRTSTLVLRVYRDDFEKFFGLWIWDCETTNRRIERQASYKSSLKPQGCKKWFLGARAPWPMCVPKYFPSQNFYEHRFEKKFFPRFQTFHWKLEEWEPDPRFPNLIKFIRKASQKFYERS